MLSHFIITPLAARYSAAVRVRRKRAVQVRARRRAEFFTDMSLFHIVIYFDY